MSRAPWVLLKPERGFPRGDETLYSTTLGWRMVNPQMPEQWTISLGESAEKLAEHARRSPARRRTRSPCAATTARAAAWDAGRYDDWVVPVPDAALGATRASAPTPSLEKLAKLKPAFSARTARSPPATPRR